MATTKKKPAKSTKPLKEWVVGVECKIIKEVITAAATAEEAAENPWANSIGERDIDMPDWKVISVEPNE